MRNIEKWNRNLHPLNCRDCYDPLCGSDLNGLAPDSPAYEAHHDDNPTIFEHDGITYSDVPCESYTTELAETSNG